jgi:hypothetical protein
MIVEGTESVLMTLTDFLYIWDQTNLSISATKRLQIPKMKIINLCKNIDLHTALIRPDDLFGLIEFNKEVILKSFKTNWLDRIEVM